MVWELEKAFDWGVSAQNEQRTHLRHWSIEEDLSFGVEELSCYVEEEEDEDEVGDVGEEEEEEWGFKILRVMVCFSMCVCV